MTVCKPCSFDFHPIVHGSLPICCSGFSIIRKKQKTENKIIHHRNLDIYIYRKRGRCDWGIIFVQNIMQGVNKRRNK